MPQFGLFSLFIQKRGTSVALTGDARFDSPGFSAKYATYYIQVCLSVCTDNDNNCLQEVESRKIIGLEVGMKAQV